MSTIFDAYFDWGGADALLRACNLQSGGLVQQTVDDAVIRYDIPYCPMDTGRLAKSAETATIKGSGEVIYDAPYAHYQYYGEVYGPNIPIYDDNTGEPTGFWSPPGQRKHPTGRPLQYSKDVNPLAGSFWFERMKADHKDDIIKEAKAAVGRK